MNQRYTPEGLFKSIQIGLRWLALILVATITTPASFSQIPAESEPVCSDCQLGICRSVPPTVAGPSSGTGVGPNGIQHGYFDPPVYEWRPIGNNCYRLYVVGYTRQVLIFTDCDGNEIPTYRYLRIFYDPESITYCEGLPVSSLPTIPEVIKNSIHNPPTEVTGPNGPVTGPPIDNWTPGSMVYNCHAVSFGCGPGQIPGNALPPPSDLPPLPASQIPPTPVIGIPIPQTGGGPGLWINHPPATAIPAGAGFGLGECDPVSTPPPVGHIVLVMCAPRMVPGPVVDYEKAIAVHSSTSNGDGTYKSKNGRNPLLTGGGYPETSGVYTNPGNQDPSDDNTYYTVCYAPN